MAWRVWVLGCVAVTLSVGCGRDSGSHHDFTPSGWIKGTDVATEHEAAIAGANALLHGHPEPAEVKPRLEALYDHFLDRFLAHGHQRETFTTAEKAAFDRAFVVGETHRSRMAYLKLKEHYRYYRHVDPEIAETILDFNMLLLYPNFDALREYEPEEARRLQLM